MGAAAPAQGYVPSGMGGARRPRFNPGGNEDNSDKPVSMKMNLDKPVASAKRYDQLHSNTDDLDDF